MTNCCKNRVQHTCSACWERTALMATGCKAPAQRRCPPPLSKAPFERLCAVAGAQIAIFLVCQTKLQVHDKACIASCTSRVCLALR